MKIFSQIALILMLSLGLVGCNTVGKMLPPNDRVLVYPLPYDLTYLRTMEILDTTSDWQLEETDKEKGTIVWLLVPWAQDILVALDKGELKLKDYDLSRWRLMHIGAQPVPPSQMIF